MSNKIKFFFPVITQEVLNSSFHMFQIAVTFRPAYTYIYIYIFIHNHIVLLVHHISVPFVAPIITAIAASTACHTITSTFYGRKTLNL